MVNLKGDEFVSKNSKGAEASKKKLKRSLEPKKSIESVQKPLKEIHVLSSSPIYWDYFENKKERYVKFFEAQGWMELLRTRTHFYHDGVGVLSDNADLRQ